MNILFIILFKYKIFVKMENNLIKGNDETEKEELTKYNFRYNHIFYYYLYFKLKK